LQPAKEIADCSNNTSKIQAKNYLKYNLQKLKRFIPLQSQNKRDKIKRVTESDFRIQKIEKVITVKSENIIDLNREAKTNVLLGNRKSCREAGRI
jgi:hypothetical protein